MEIGMQPTRLNRISPFTNTPAVRHPWLRALALGLALASAGVALDLVRPVAAQQRSSMSVPLAPDAPEQYVVKKGDTLWDIAGVFLRDPWYWPEIWHANPEIANPHLIYPGDVLYLSYVDGRPRVMLGQSGALRLSPQVRSTPLKDAVTIVPYDLIMDFVGRPSLLSKDQAQDSPYVVGLRDAHLIGAIENEIYGRGIDNAPVASRYTIVHVGDELRDPEDDEVLGYMGHFAGTAEVMRSGELPKLKLVESAREVLQGDRLLPAQVDFGDDLAIRAPGKLDLEGQIMAVVDGVHVVGRYQVVAINRGERDGLAAGNAVAIYERGAVVRDRFDDSTWFNRVGGNSERVELPDERSGMVLLFRVFDRMSYGLVVESTHAMRVGDFVRHPDRENRG
jgi:hypothetical protein